MTETSCSYSTSDPK